MPTILAVDLGTKTGWALSQKKIIYSGTYNFANDRFQGGGMRYLKFHRWLSRLQELDGGVNEVYFEEVRHHVATDAAHVYGGFMATLTSWCESQKIPYQGVPVKTIKKSITGKGNANKKDVMDAVKALGYKPIDDNEADAIALLLYKTNP